MGVMSETGRTAADDCLARDVTFCVEVWLSGGVELSEYTEERVDGTHHRITEKDNKFFVVEDGVLYTGNQDLVSENDDEQALADAELTARYKGLFDVWEKELLGMSIEEITDPEALETMRALGYIDDEGADEH